MLLSSISEAQVVSVGFFFFRHTQMRLFRPLGNQNPLAEQKYLGIDISAFSFQQTNQGGNFPQTMGFF